MRVLSYIKVGLNPNVNYYRITHKKNQHINESSVGLTEIFA